jgi:PhzF family phenazine biosynthesis protein
MNHTPRPAAPAGAHLGAEPEVLRLAAFTRDPAGGNPAGVVLDASTFDDARMQAIAAEVGYSETAFVTGSPFGDQPLRVRYFSPEAEVDFCGHATIATAVALGSRHGDGTLHFDTNAGHVPVAVRTTDACTTAELTSVETSSTPATDSQVDETLDTLHWTRSDLGSLPPHVAFAGNHHLILHVAQRSTLARLDYDFDALRSVMAAEGWTTVALVHPDRDVFHARNPFPVGGVVEDPATGAAAAALGGYLLDIGAVREPRTLPIHQGDDMGRPSRLTITLDPADRRVKVAGTAVPLP